MTTNLDYKDKKTLSFIAEWKTEPPTQQGVYWVYARAWDGDMVLDITSVAIMNGIVSIYFPVGGAEAEPDFKAKDVTHWMGPLPIPELPE